MIFYFSGTGNSLQVAKNIGEKSGEELVSIARVMNSKDGCFEYELRDNETIGFVYPIYAWAPPKMVLNFIEKLRFKNYKNNYVFSVATCGGNIGNTMKLVNEYLKKKNMNLNSGFSISMPNNYITMGNVDTRDKEGNKLLAAETTLKNINNVIMEKKSGVFEVNKGFWPFLLTSVINPMFNKNAISTKKFYAKDNCTSCGICESVCNSNTIKVNGKPQWGEACTQCFACIHYCPVKAIQFGKATESKGRYKNPNITLEEMKINTK
jgi:NAD-dependent dihydropyrimidine dehydrogenase PreA subunit/flavodoxin